MAEENEKDVSDKIMGEEYGALAGHTWEDGLKIMVGMTNERAAENLRLRRQVADLQQPTPEKVEPKPASVDLDVIRGDDQEKAAEELNRHTREVVGDVVKEQFAARDESNFPTQRQQARVAAAEMIRQAGGDFSKFEKEIDGFMNEQNKMSRASQVDPGMWAQAFTTLEGIHSMRGNQPEPTGTPHVERPTPNAPQSRGKAVLTPVETEVRDNFARVSGTPISDGEWKFFAEKGEGPGEPKMNVDDYEEYVAHEAERQKRRR